jgi:hypothetical protein
MQGAGVGGLFTPLRWIKRSVKVFDFTVDDEAPGFRLQLKKMVDGGPA